MPSKIPSGYEDLYSASNRLNASVNVIGVVTDVRSPCKSRGRDWVCTFSITDFTYEEAEEGLLVRFFRPMKMELPKIQGTGDVVILRHIKIIEWSGRTIALSSKTTSCVVFASDSIPEKAPPKFQLTYTKDPTSAAPLPAEMEYAIFLCNSRDRSQFRKLIETHSHNAGTSSPTHSAPQRSRDKFSLIKDVEPDKYYDLVGQVVKIYPSNGNVELYLTDYTVNSKLFLYEWGLSAAEDVKPREGDEFGYASRKNASRKWPGPFGQLTLTVTLWSPHCYFAQSYVKENDFVHLRNVRIRNSKGDRVEGSKGDRVEGSVHTDGKYPDKVDVSILTDHENDERVKNVLRRKREYTERFKVQSQDFINKVREKRKSEDDEKHMSKAQSRKKKKQQKEQESMVKSKTQNNERLNGSNTEDVIMPSNPNQQVLNKNSTQQVLNKNSTDPLSLFCLNSNASVVG